MIKITVNPDANPTTYRFNQDLVVIGDGLPGAVDICFPSEGMHQNHVRILVKKEGCTIINQANDPFVTLNGQPFWKKSLKAGDLLQIRNHILSFDEISFREEAEAEALPPPAFPDVEALYHDEDPEAWYPADLEIEAEKRQEAPQKKSESKPPHPIDPRVEEAYQLAQDPGLKKRARPPGNKGSTFKLVKWMAIAILIAVATATLMLAEIYLRAENISEWEEMAAAEGLSDYAMALTYAKVYQASIQKQNWVDPQFIRDNLIDLLSSTSIPCGDIDGQGTFCNTPYFLRVYTNRDASRFLLIAQPVASLSQWLFPKRTLLVDSQEMQLRTIDDMRHLNRLLSSPNPLDGEEGEDLAKTVRQLPSLKLNELAKKSENREFAPPAALRFLSPEAENLIYNAPRYHHLTGTFLKKAQAIIAQPYGPHVAALLQNDLDQLIRLPHLVYYVDADMQEALKKRLVLRKLSVPAPFFTAYLLHDQEKRIAGSRLVFDSSQEYSPHELELAEQPFFKPKTARKKIVEGDQTAKQIREIADSAQKAIVPILQSLHTLLNDAAERDSLYLSPLFYNLLDQYEEQKKKIASTLQGKVPEDSQGEKLLRETGLWDIYQAYKKQPPQEESPETAYVRWQAVKQIGKLGLKKKRKTE